jgi:hypothetical protein
MTSTISLNSSANGLVYNHGREYLTTELTLDVDMQLLLSLHGSSLPFFNPYNLDGVMFVTSFAIATS